MTGKPLDPRQAKGKKQAMTPSNSLPTVETRFYSFGGPDEPFRLRGGGHLPGVTLAYEMYGELNADRSNAILLFHALSGSQHAAGFNPAVPGVGARWNKACQAGWWDAFIGSGRALNTDKFCVICVNYLGGCYGSTGPTSLNPATGRPYGGSFPALSLSDIVDSQARLLDHLGIHRLHAVIGASLGGMMCLCFSTLYPDRVGVVVPIATSMYTTSLQRIHNLEQILAVENDPCFQGGDYSEAAPPERGLALARMIAHKTYVSLETMEERANMQVMRDSERFQSYRPSHPIESYLLHHGEKFVERFDANSYLRIMEAWQRFDLVADTESEGFEDLFEACRHQRYMVFSIDSDVSFFPQEQRQIAHALKGAGVPCRYIIVHSDKGHDAFLLEPELFAPHLIYSLENPW
jgi:homoserine O-acetyltransferase